MSVGTGTIDSKRQSASESWAIEVRDITVSFRSYKERPTSLKESILKFLRSGKLRHYSTFDALSHLSLQVEKGTVLGVIGSNGSGKSTLLKVLAGVLVPKSGEVKVNGIISSLIELGAGFDRELNAVENIYLNGSLYKRSRAQIRARVQHILEFAELSEFAETPIKYYSSGMFARLGFSVAIDIDPEILLVDEILAVGDERFQKKCQGVFANFISSGKTIVLVSHNVEMLEKQANQIALLSKGQLIYLGDPKTAISIYRDSSYESSLTDIPDCEISPYVGDAV